LKGGMTIMGRHERVLREMKLERAIRWIGDQLQEKPTANRGLLIDAASVQFGLSPLQEEFLHHIYLQVA